MLFSIQSAAANGSESAFNALDQILARVELDVHQMEIADADLLLESSWYQSCRTDRRKLLEKIVQASAYRSTASRGPHLRRVDVADDVSAERARALAFTPLTLLLENKFSDGALVTAAVRTIGEPQSVELCFGSGSRTDPAALVMVSGGGHGELLKLLDQHLEEAVERQRPPRLIVVADSDGEWPGDVKQHAERIREVCAAKGVPCPPLNKRTAENYIPDSVWSAWVAQPEHTSARPAVAALLALSAAQRDHVKMGKPNEAPWDASKADVALLYVGVPAPDEAALTAANLKGKGSDMMIFSLDFHKSALSPEALHSRDPQDDLPRLVRQIEEEL